MGIGGSNDPKGYYKLLGVQPDATMQQIKSAFKKKQIEYNPNGPKRNAIRDSDEYLKLSKEMQEKKENELDERLSEINAAYSVIGDEQRRKEYDSGMGQFGGGGGAEGFFNGQGGMSMEDIFSMFSGGMSRGGSSSQKPENTVSKISISLKESYTGKKSKFKITTNKQCVGCRGSGYKKTTTCSVCKGHGRVIMQKTMGFMVTKQEIPCDKCEGSGKMGDGPACFGCKGDKVIRDSSIIEVMIPAGVVNNQKIIFKEKGNFQPGVGKGDLVFVISVSSDPLWCRKGYNLIGKVDIDMYTAILGGTLYYTHIDGTMCSVNISPLKDFKDVIKIPFEGFSSNQGKKGDLFLEPALICNRNVNKEQLAQVLSPLIKAPQTSCIQKKFVYSKMPSNPRDPEYREDTEDEFSEYDEIDKFKRRFSGGVQGFSFF